MTDTPLSTAPSGPVDYSRLQTPRLKLLPFLSEHFDTYTATHFEAAQKGNFELYRWQLGVPETLEILRETFRSPMFQPPNMFLSAVILSKTTVTRSVETESGNTVETFEVPEGTFAGWAAIEYHESLSSAEIGLTIHSEFHRTFVATEVNALMLRHLLNPQPLDLEMRRVMWKCNAMNAVSRRAAERLGFQLEGISRYTRIMSKRWADMPAVVSEKDAKGEIPKTTPKGEELGAPGHTAYYSICWDDWQNGGRERIDAVMSKYGSQ